MIRDFCQEDAERLSEIHRSQGFDYKAPDLEHPLFIVKKVREVNGRVVAALALRITAETYLLCEGGPVEKGRAIEELQPALLKEAFDKGLDDVICVVPPEIVESFTPALEKMGWARDRNWAMFSRSTDAERGQPS